MERLGVQKFGLFLLSIFLFSKREMGSDYSRFAALLSKYICAL